MAGAPNMEINNTTPNTTETQIQKNTIDLLKAMGWQFKQK
ncbi:hypothetical protein CRYPA_1126 [uncultured Candidatus Thioglobus sp.]|nr:hypothetical protein CRYPA_1126 [uncultured Candidatus Thioglobus sp.]